MLFIGVLIIISPKILYMFYCFHPIVFYCFVFIKYKLGVVMQVLSAKLIRCEMINIVSKSRVSRTHTVGFSIGFCLYFSGRRWKIDSLELQSKH